MRTLFAVIVLLIVAYIVSCFVYPATGLTERTDLGSPNTIFEKFDYTHFQRHIIKYYSAAGFTSTAFVTNNTSESIEVSFTKVSSGLSYRHEVVIRIVIQEVEKGRAVIKLPKPSNLSTVSIQVYHTESISPKHFLLSPLYFLESVDVLWSDNYDFFYIQ